MIFLDDIPWLVFAGFEFVGQALGGAIIVRRRGREVVAITRASSFPGGLAACSLCGPEKIERDGRAVGSSSHSPMARIIR